MGNLGLKEIFTRRLPNLHQVTSVYGVIVLFVYGWSIYWFLWQLPSWMHFRSPKEILITFAYVVAANFFESAITLFAVTLLCFILPQKWFRDQFTSKGVVLVVVFFASIPKYLQALDEYQAIPPGMLKFVLAGLVGLVLVFYLVGQIGFFRKLIEDVADRTIIFLYVIFPISLISLLVVLIRNVVEAFRG